MFLPIVRAIRHIVVRRLEIRDFDQSIPCIPIFFSIPEGYISSCSYSIFSDDEQETFEAVESKAPVIEKVDTAARINSPLPRKESVPESDDEDEGDERYEVARILRHKIDDVGSILFRIKWKGYGQEDNTWEPLDNLDCKEMLDAFIEMDPELRDLMRKARK